MDIWNLIGRAYVAPFERWRAAVTIYWLPGVMWLVVWLVFEAGSLMLGLETLGASATVGVLIVVFALFFYQSIVMASGLIRWHQHLIDGAHPRSARLWLSGEECPYWWRWFCLGVVMCLLALLFAGVLAVIFVPDFFSDHAAKSSDVAFDRISSGSFVLAMALVGWLFPRTFLSLAAVAIGEKQSFSVEAQRIVTKTDCTLLTLGILMTAAPFLLASIGISAWLPERSLARMAPGYVLGRSFSCLLDFLAMIVFASLLSLFYRAPVVEGGTESGSP
jgi:hypothetical protein